MSRVFNQRESRLLNVFIRSVSYRKLTKKSWISRKTVSAYMKHNQLQHEYFKRDSSVKRNCHLYPIECFDPSHQ